MYPGSRSGAGQDIFSLQKAECERVMRGFLLTGLLVALAAVSVAGPQAAPRPAAPRATPLPTQPPAEPPQAVFDRESLTPEYRIAPGDVLQIFVWREADLSREVRVRPDGFLTVPLIGDLFAAGRTLKGLAAELGQQLGKFVTEPIVNVALKESAALRFYVVGQVERPGEFPLVGRTTVMQALALAGKFQEYAKTDEIKILRQEFAFAGGVGRTREIAVPVNFKALSQGQGLKGNVLLKAGDVIVVP
jgi:polysaccharide export outer membrane protein